MSQDKRIPAEVFPPGEFIRDELEERGWTQDDLASVLDRPLPVVNQIITGKCGITPQTAHGLAEAFGTSAEFWMNVDSAYRLSVAEGQGGEVRERARLYEIAPVKDMTRRGWIQKANSADDLAAELRRFFAVGSLDELRPMRVAARASMDVATPAHQAWFWRVATLSGMLTVAPFADSGVDDVAQKLRMLAAYPEEARKVPRVLAQGGIRFVVVEHLPHTAIDGAALWLDRDSPVIGMSLRYDRIDYFWHTLFHELDHIRNRDEGTLDADLAESGRNDRSYGTELRANMAAASALIRSDDLESFIVRVKPLYSKQRIIQFARVHKVHPGIVAGQLQHRGEIKYAANREMLMKVRDIVIQEALTDGWGHRVETKQ